MEGRFIDNGDGTLTDVCLNVMWSKESFSGNWTQVHFLCQQFRAGGYDDWRVPNVMELFSLVRMGGEENGIAWSNLELNSVVDWYWSSTPRGPGGAWMVSFYKGDVDGAATWHQHQCRAIRALSN